MCAFVSGVQTCALPLFHSRSVEPGRFALPLRSTLTAGSCATCFFRNSISTCVACCPPKITRPSPQNRPNTRSSVVRRNSWPQGWRQCAASVKLPIARTRRSEEHTSELQVTNAHLVCRLLLEKKQPTHT